jgi:hypothetical protein
MIERLLLRDIDQTSPHAQAENKRLTQYPGFLQAGVRLGVNFEFGRRYGTPHAMRHEITASRRFCEVSLIHGMRKQF